eukprot:TRINITY_DN37712_c0_g1_i1.p2 TRINITY_DN37712_c0_g1~~TRINITY_DN37712_c0_g1_i1.p2  ORF type:complete len:151 (-),score=26.11 TRINITY_DN37712_c0_g1_i1:23-475(-)
MSKTAGRRPKATKKGGNKYTIDCAGPVDDGIMDAGSFEKFLHDRIKVDGKTNNLGDIVSVAREGSKVHVTASGRFSKRYLKYLTKKYLKKQQLRDWLHVVANSRYMYTLKYFDIQGQEEEEDEDQAACLYEAARPRMCRSDSPLDHHKRA